MELEDTVEFVNSALKKQVSRVMTEAEAAILAGAWHHHTYEQVAITCGYSLNYLQRNAAPKFWKLLNQVLQRQLNKTNARAILTQLVQEAAGKTRSAPNPQTPVLWLGDRAEPPYPHAPAQVDWGEAPDVSIFYGREQELETLAQWFGQDRCKLIALLGMGGIGKSSLAAKAIRQVVENRGDSPPFELIIWRSLRNAPPLETLLTDLVPFLSQQQDAQANLERLLHWLRTHRCLVILDNLETILQPGRVGYYQPGYESYGDLLRLLGETTHRSCVLLTSREKPAEISTFEAEDGRVRSLSLLGSRIASLALIESKKLVGTDAEKQQLCEFYSCSPLALKIVSASIQSIFDGAIAPFLAQETTVFNGLRRLLDQQFERLSGLEQSAMFWFAINREWIPFSELVADFVPTLSRSALLEVLESLIGRSLIEKKAGSYTQQPVLMEYVTSVLIQRVSEELTQSMQSSSATTAYPIFQTHALMKTTVKEHIREGQTRLILQPISHQLQSAYPSKMLLEQQILNILTLLRQLQPQQMGYGCGNLINLCRSLNLDLSDYDFSKLTISHAYLRDIPLQRVKLVASHLRHCCFQESFSGIHTVAFSPDGNYFAGSGTSGDIQLWTTETVQQLLTLKGHTNWVWAIAFAPQGNRLASASADRTIKVWDVPSGQCLQTLQGHTNWVWSVAFADHGNRLVSCGDDTSIRIWEVSSGRSLGTLAEHQDTVRSVAVSADNSIIASGSADQTIKIWDAQTHQCLKTLIGHSSPVWVVAFCPNSRILASSGNDRIIKLWDVHAGTCLKTLEGHQNVVRALAFSSDGQLLATGGGDRTIKLWHVESGQCIQTLLGHQNLIWSLAFGTQDQLLLSGSDDQTIKLWNLEDGVCLQSFAGYSNTIRSVTCSADGHSIVSGSDDRTVRVWDVPSGQCLQTLTGHQNWVWSVACSTYANPQHLDPQQNPPQTIIASGSADKTIKLWDLASGTCIKTLMGHSNWAWSVVHHPTKPLLASGSADQTIKLWDLSSGNCLQTLTGHQNWIYSVAISPTGDRLVSGSADQTIKLWDLLSGDCLQTLVGHQGWVCSVAISPTGDRLVSGSADQTVKLWDLRSGHCLQTLTGHQNWVWSVAMSSTGDRLASGSGDRTIRLWDLRSGQCIHTLSGHTRTVRSLCFNAQNNILISAGEDGVIILWDLDTGEMLNTLRISRPYEDMNIAKITGITEAQKTTLRALGAVG